MRGEQGDNRRVDRGGFGEQEEISKERRRGHRNAHDRPARCSCRLLESEQLIARQDLVGVRAVERGGEADPATVGRSHHGYGGQVRRASTSQAREQV